MQCVEDEGAAPPGKKASFAKAWCLAAEARERDQELIKKRNADFLRDLDGPSQHRVADVQQRQLEVLFREIEGFERFLPSAVQKAWLLPIELDKEQEIREVRFFDRVNKWVSDPAWRAGQQMDWLLTQSECLFLLRVAGMWMRTTRGWFCPLGIDRSTFCRFLLDLGLVDQDAVPYTWAAWLFDSAARRVRLGGDQLQPSANTPVVPMLSQWHLLCVMDVILKRHFAPETKASFLHSLLPIARLRLPGDVIEESGGALAPSPVPAEAPRGTPPPVDRGSILSVSDFGSDAVESAVNTKAECDASDAGAGVADEGVRLESRRGSVISVRAASHEGIGGVSQRRRSLLLPPEVDSGMLDVRRERATRWQLVRSMLVEPEVLHVAAQHQEVFRRLHAPYADEQGHMTFPMLMQFCTDFGVTPALASAHSLQELYASAECCDLVPAADEAQAEAAPAGDGAPRRLSGTAGTAKCAAAFLAARRKSAGGGSRRGSAAPAATPAPPPPGQGDEPEGGSPRRARRSGEQPRRASLAASPQGAAAPPRSQGAGMRRQASPPDPGVCAAPSLGDGSFWKAADVAAPSVPPKGSQAHGWSQPSACGQAGDALPWRQVAARAAAGGRAPAGGPSEAYAPVFGPGALAELLLGAAFAYLGYYASGPQNCTGAHARAIWLVTYLRSSFAHLRASLDRRAAAAEGASAAPPAPGQARLERALRSIPAELWAVPPLPAPGLLRERAAVPPGVPNKGNPQVGRSSVQRAPPSKEGSVTSREDSKPPPGSGAGAASARESALLLPSPPPSRPASSCSSGPAPGDASPGIVEGRCRLCGCGLGVSPWGNPRCRGCSAVEVVRLEHHPLRPLLLDWPAGFHRLPTNVVLPVFTEPVKLTPPPTPRVDKFREHAAADQTVWAPASARGSALSGRRPWPRQSSGGVSRAASGRP